MISVKPNPRPKVSPTATSMSCLCFAASDCADDVLEGVEVEDKPVDVETKIGRETEGGRVCVGKADEMEELTGTCIVMFPISK